MLDIAKFKTDPKKEEEGVWQPAGEGCDLLVARFGNPKSARLFAAYTKPYRRQIDNGSMDPDKQVEILCRVMAEAILLGWRGMKEGERVVEYSTAEAFRLLKTYRELREMVEDYAKDAEAYREAELEEAEGN